jgi:REP element-mobilizing transposase RayT
MLTGRPKHLNGSEYLGPRQYFLTFCTHERKRLFTTADAVLVARTQIERAAAEQSIALLAYCYLPDHVHFLAEGKAEESDCLRFITRAKQFSGFHYKATFGQRLWQRYGFEHILRSEESALSVARYIIENPLRARLVVRVHDYPFSGSSVYTLEQILDAIQLRDQWYSRSEGDGPTTGPAEAGRHKSG